jgi:hypothetical protein
MQVNTHSAFKSPVGVSQMIKLLLILAVPICLLEGIPLFREKKWPELSVFGILIGVTLLLGIGDALGWPPPLEMLQRLLRPVGEIIFKQF